ncbi:aldo/keto reductase [Terrarubrum flagellatum]|uniref:aldo/keto reductase n=1 Tax=Terrirubrum flagellatum TaxID=2895980 RepID=UPI003144E5C6
MRLGSMSPLPTRAVGRTGLGVSLMGFGSAPLGELYAKLDEDICAATVRGARNAGITLFDSSPHYGNGLAEHRLGSALRKFPRDNYVLCTKVGRHMNPLSKPAAATAEDVISPGFAGGLSHPAKFDYSYDGVMRSVEQSLLRLATSHIDILLIHDVDVWTHGDQMETRFKEAMEGAYVALDKLRSEKVVKAIGCGLNESEMCERFARAGDFDCMLLAGRYSLLEQDALNSFLPLAVEKNISILLGGVFNSGILATGPIPGAKYNYRDAPPDIMQRAARIEALCKSHNVPLPVAAMRFALGHPAIASIVLGAVTPQEIARNMEGFTQRVPQSLWKDLRAAGLMRDDAPMPPEALS